MQLVGLQVVRLSISGPPPASPTTSTGLELHQIRLRQLLACIQLEFASLVLYLVGRVSIKKRIRSLRGVGTATAPAPQSSE